jgi:hypothetical protein
MAPSESGSPQRHRGHRGGYSFKECFTTEAQRAQRNMFLLWREVPPKQKRLSLFEATFILLLRDLRVSSESYERVVK